jgi:multidrug efflux pump
MRFSQSCIDRPVLSTVMSLVILVFGAIAVTRLPNRELPDVDPPVVSVVTVLPGAAAEVVETSVTQVLEDEIIGIEGIRHITSESREQTSSITIEFELARDVDAAAADVRDRVARVRRFLPEEVDDPVVAKADADARAIMWLDLHGGGFDPIQLSTLAETQLLDRFSKLPGVSRVILSGERRHAIRVWIDRDRLTARGLSIGDVRTALQRENIDIPSGRVESLDQEFSVRTLGELHTPEEYAELIVANRDGQPVRLGDLARVEVGAEDERSLVRVNGQPAVGLGIVKQSQANTLDVAAHVHREIEAARLELPAGLRFEAGFDSAPYIERSVRDVTTTIFEAVGLVLIVIFVFLRSLRATLIPAVAIPISVIGTFAVLYFADFSINTLTLMGLTLAIGLVVDDAIVVLENVTRWIEQGSPPLEAARRGMDEIAFAVVASTVSAIAVFLPLAFLTDATGRLFREFGVTVAASVAVSGFVALTLSPALCALFLRPRGRERGLRAMLRESVERLRARYQAALGPVLRRPGLALGAGALWVGVGFVLLARLDREFVPVADRGAIQTFVRAPEGATLEYTDRYQKQVEAILGSVPEIAVSFSLIGMGFNGPPIVNQGIIFTSFVPFEERERSQQEVVGELFGRLMEIPGIQAFPNNSPTLGTSFRSSPISMVLQGPDSRQLALHADEVVRRGQAVPGVVNLQSDLKLNKPQLDVRIDRDRASDLGVSVREIASTLQILLGGLDLSSFKLRGETYDVIGQLERSERADPRDLYGLYVRSANGTLVPLDSLVHVQETISAPALPHFDRMRAATVTGNVRAGVPLGGALEQMRAIAEEVLPDGQGYRVTFSGESEQFYESGNALLFAYILAVVLIYLVLAAQFESFVHPATVLVAVGLSFTGALLSLALCGQTLNLFSEIGLVMLVGLIAKNAILIVEFANQLRERGHGVLQAVTQAASTRFRPVLMTALSTMAGILPIALGVGAGGEARAPLGIAVVGGMAFATALTFFLVPVVYLGFATLERRLRRTEAVVAAD